MSHQMDSQGSASLTALVSRLDTALSNVQPRQPSGRVTKVRGSLIHAALRRGRVGEVCRLFDPSIGDLTRGEIVGFANGEAIIAPLSELSGISLRTEVQVCGHVPAIEVGPRLLGSVVGSDGREMLRFAPSRGGPTTHASIRRPPPSLTLRRATHKRLLTGVAAIDGLLTLACGQRVGIIGSADVGKSTLLRQLAMWIEADVIVLALVGERAKEVSDIVQILQGSGRAAKTVVVCATSDRPAVDRMNAVLAATAVAEYFRDEGLHVALLVDSMTRYARAARSVALASGEPMARRGYPASVFDDLPRVFERAGNLECGCITALYSVLADDESETDPLVEEMISLLDGHIFLSRDCARRSLFPAIDLLRSRSRSMNAVVTSDHLAAADAAREALTEWARIELLVRVGEYTPGQDAKSDRALALQPRLNAFIHDRCQTPRPFDHSLAALKSAVR